MLIALDAGHGGSDPGAVYNGRREKDDNLKLAMAVGDILKNEGMDVFYTRDNDIYETPFKKATDANNSGADYFVSFHRNSGENPNAASGVQVLIYSEGGEKEQLAENILDNLTDLGFKDLGVIERPNLVVLKRTNMPAVLIETGFINNDSDNEKFDDEFEQIAAAIADGILKTIGSSKGNDAVMDALNKALSSPLLETTIEGASYVLFNVEGKAGIKEMNEAARCIQSIAGRDVHILWGTVGDVDGDRDEVTVTLIATGIRECEKKIVEPDFVSIEKNRYKSPIEEMSIKVPAFLQKKIKNNL